MNSFTLEKIYRFELLNIKIKRVLKVNIALEYKNLNNSKYSDRGISRWVVSIIYFFCNCQSLYYNITEIPLFRTLFM